MSSNTDSDEPPWKRVKRSNYHRQRYGTAIERPLDMTSDANPWRFDVNRRDVWLAVWARCSFRELLACSSVCRRWRAELLESGTNVDVWGVGGIDGRWLVACLPLLASLTNTGYNYSGTAGKRWYYLTKEQQWQLDTCGRIDRRFLLTSTIAKSLPVHPAVETLVRAAVDQWQTPSTLRVGYQRRRATVEKRRLRTEEARSKRARLIAPLDGTLLRWTGSKNVDARVNRVRSGFVERGSIILPPKLKAVAKLASYGCRIDMPRWLWMQRERCTTELIRRHRRSVMHQQMRWSPGCEDVPFVHIYQALFDWTLARSSDGGEATADVVKRFTAAGLLDGGGGGDEHANETC